MGSFVLCPERGATTAGAVLLNLARDPVQLVRRWNWKSALLSPIFRAAIFFFANLTAGIWAALGAMGAEFTFRSLGSGFYGALTQSLRRVEPHWQARLAALLLLPAVNHSLEFLVHWLRGTPNLKTSVLASLCFTTISSLFHLHVMRHGALIVGEGAQSLWADLKRMPRLVLSFLIGSRSRPH